jgi:hypothetical protein
MHGQQNIIPRWTVSKTSNPRSAHHTKPYTLHASNANARRETKQVETGVCLSTFSCGPIPLTTSPLRTPPPPSFKRNPILNFFLSPNQDELHVIRASNVNIQLFGRVGALHRHEYQGREATVRRGGLQVSVAPCG